MYIFWRSVKCWFGQVHAIWRQPHHDWLKLVVVTSFTFNLRQHPSYSQSPHDNSKVVSIVNEKGRAESRFATSDATSYHTITLAVALWLELNVPICAREQHRFLANWFLFNDFIRSGPTICYWGGHPAAQQ